MSELNQTLVDLNSYAFSGQQNAELEDLSSLSEESKRELRMVGVDVDRITSYNVCYTKLLRESRFLRRSRRPRRSLRQGRRQRRREQLSYNFV